MPPGYNTYAAVVRTTPPELGDTTVGNHPMGDRGCDLDLDPGLGADLGTEKVEIF